MTLKGINAPMYDWDRVVCMCVCICQSATTLKPIRDKDDNIDRLTWVLACQCSLTLKTHQNIFSDKVNPQIITALPDSSGLRSRTMRPATTKKNCGLIWAVKRTSRLTRPPNSPYPNVIRHTKASQINWSPTLQPAELPNTLVLDTTVTPHVSMSWQVRATSDPRWGLHSF